jgi:hypothetical protein
VATRLDAFASVLVAQVRPRSASASDIDALLGQLGRMVESSAGALGLLKDNDEFWTLVVRIAALRRAFGRPPVAHTEAVRRRERSWGQRATSDADRQQS